ncbi:hypothetical protein CEXT_522001 [Caerostris extrusa]|uniref:Uncharacterized protein n=1 Tax=Caerostris extrusa TaxID=172846 RepID=A0AAV4QCT6_CAEEX|nr:hypothetical protein CEXT_522001 [Caerostris extrusa]
MHIIRRHWRFTSPLLNLLAKYDKIKWKTRKATNTKNDKGVQEEYEEEIENDLFASKQPELDIHKEKKNLEVYVA